MITRRLFILAAASLLSACASTTIRDTWSDPAFHGGPFKRILVLGVSSDLPDRRIFEDIMATRVGATGVQTMQAYRYLPEAGKVDEATLDRAVRTSGADALLMSRIRSVDRKTSVSTVMVPTPVGYGGFGWYGWYSGWYPVTEVRHYDVAVVETSLFDAASKRVIWAGVTETFEPRSIANDTPGFADVIIKALREKGLLPAAK